MSDDGGSERERLAYSAMPTLYGLALRLTSVHNLNELLHECVSEARRLLAVDVAFLALKEESGALQTRVTDGSLGPRLRELQSASPPLALAGRVMETGEPVQTSDYLGESAITHMTDVDDAVEAEGLRSVLGVPLRRRGEIIGVLYVSERAERRFDPAEVSLLSSLAALSAVAIDNAQLLEGYREAADELRQANEELEVEVALHDRFLAIALDGGSVTEILDVLARHCGGQAALYDHRATLVGRAGDPSATAGVDVDERDRTCLDGAGSARASRVCECHASLLVRVATAERVLGSLVLHADAGFRDHDIRVAERAALTVALLLSVEASVAESERRSTTELLEEIALGRIGDDTAFERRARVLGVDLTVPHTVAVIDSPDLDRTVELLRGVVERQSGLVGQLLGQVVVLVRGGDEAVRAAVPVAGPVVTVGLAGPATGPAGVASAYEEARACVAALGSMGREGTIASARDLGPFRFLLSTAERYDAVRFVERTLGPLLDHDASRDTDLVRTADAYFLSDRRNADAARVLHIHVNTLAQRLDRISVLLGEDWRSAERGLEVQMALSMHRMIGNLPPR